MAHDPLDFENYSKWLAREETKERRYYEKLLPVIGSATLAFAHLEWMLNKAFAQVVNQRDLEIGLCIADRLNYSQTVDLFETVCRELTKAFSPQIQKELTNLIAGLRKAGPLRNEITHCSFDYVFGSDDACVKTPSRIKGKKKDRNSYVDNPFPALETAVVTICQTEDLLASFVSEYL